MAKGGGGWRGLGHVTRWVCFGRRWTQKGQARAQTHRQMNGTAFGAASHIRSHKWSIQVKSESVRLLGQHADVLQSTVGAGFPSINSAVKPKKTEERSLIHTC